MVVGTWCYKLKWFKMASKYLSTVVDTVHDMVKIMINENIWYISYRKNIKTDFLISNVYCKELHLDNFKGDFLNIFFIKIFKQLYLGQIFPYPNKLYINGKLSDDA